jgi:hypothetical protein
MPYFQITIEVAGLKCPVDDGYRAAGFFTNRLAQGVDQKEAFGNAKNRLLAESKVVHLIEMSRQNGGDEPRGFMTEALEISFWTYLFSRNRQGLILYPEDELDDDVSKRATPP